MLSLISEIAYNGKTPLPQLYLAAPEIRWVGQTDGHFSSTLPLISDGFSLCSAFLIRNKKDNSTMLIHLDRDSVTTDVLHYKFSQFMKNPGEKEFIELLGSSSLSKHYVRRSLQEAGASHLGNLEFETNQRHWGVVYLPKENRLFIFGGHPSTVKEFKAFDFDPLEFSKTNTHDLENQVYKHERTKEFARATEYSFKKPRLNNAEHLAWASEGRSNGYSDMRDYVKRQAKFDSTHHLSFWTFNKMKREGISWPEFAESYQLHVYGNKHPIDDLIISQTPFSIIHPKYPYESKGLTDDEMAIFNMAKFLTEKFELDDESKDKTKNVLLSLAHGILKTDNINKHDPSRSDLAMQCYKLAGSKILQTENTCELTQGFFEITKIELLRNAENMKLRVSQSKTSAIQK